MSKTESENNLKFERINADSEGYAFGWTNCSESFRQIAQAVAVAANAAGLGNITVEDISVGARSGEVTGIKVTDTTHTNLSDFWRLVDGVEFRLGSDYRADKLEAGKLNKAVVQTIEDKKSRELDRRSREDNIKRSSAFFEDMLEP